MWMRIGTALAVLLLAAPVWAGDDCPKVADAWTLARCAAARSEAVLRARYELDAARGRHLTSEQLLPANPTIDVGVGRRQAETGAVDVDRGVELSQAFEIGGQRGLRVAVSDVGVLAAKAKLEAAERQVTIDVLDATVEVRRAQMAVRFATEQRELAQRLAEVSAARARDGVGPGLDVELAEAARVQARREQVSAARALRDASARLALVVGADVQLADGSQIQIAEPHQTADELVKQALERRQVVRAAQADADAGRRRVDLLRRERIPNITLGAQYRHEEFSEVAAARLSVPLPIFRRNQGEIAEQQALVAQADTAVQQGKLKVALEVRASFAAWEQARSLLHDIPADLESRLGADAQALQDAYVRGTIPLPTALASLREVFNARRAVAEARAEATLAALDLLSASASSVAPAPPEEKP